MNTLRIDDHVADDLALRWFETDPARIDAPGSMARLEHLARPGSQVAARAQALLDTHRGAS